MGPPARRALARREVLAFGAGSSWFWPTAADDSRGEGQVYSRRNGEKPLRDGERTEGILAYSRCEPQPRPARRRRRVLPACAGILRQIPRLSRARLDAPCSERFLSEPSGS